jgi:hypothetical protein
MRKIHPLAVILTVIFLGFFVPAACPGCITTTNPETGEEVVDWERTALLFEVTSDEFRELSQFTSNPDAQQTLLIVSEACQWASHGARAFAQTGEPGDLHAALALLMEATVPLLTHEDENVRIAVHALRSTIRITTVYLPPASGE